VRSVYSLTNAQQIVAGDAGAEPAPLLVPPFDVAGTRAALDRNPDLTGLFISPDRETAGILVEIEDRTDDHEYRGALIRSLRAIAAEVTDDGVSMHLTGIAVQKNDVSEFIARDTRWLMPLAVVVLAVVLGVFFRHPLGVVLPLAVTGITVAATMAAYGRAGFQVNAITAPLPPVLMVLSLAVSVHVIQGWLEAAPGGQRHAHPRRRAPSALSVFLLRGDHRDRRRLARHQSDARGAAVRRLRRVRHRVVVRRRDHPGAGRAHVPHAARVAARRTAPSVVRRAAALDRDAGGGPALASDRRVCRHHRAGARRPAVRAQQHRPGAVPEVGRRRDTMFIDAHLTGANTLDFIVTRHDGGALTGADDLRRLETRAGHPARPHVTGVTSIPAARQVQRPRAAATRCAFRPTTRRAARPRSPRRCRRQRLIRKPPRGLYRSAANVRLHAVGTAEVSPLAAAVLDGRRLLGDDYEIQATGRSTASPRPNSLVSCGAASLRSAVFSLSGAVPFVAHGGRRGDSQRHADHLDRRYDGGVRHRSQHRHDHDRVGGDRPGGDDTIHPDEFDRATPATGRRRLETTTGVGTALLMNNLPSCQLWSAAGSLATITRCSRA
jgi:hypothetical protein